MKFCYIDESGAGSEPTLVMACIIADATRMHVTKATWDDFLNRLSKATGRAIEEFHTKDFYRGNKQWRTIKGEERKKVISAILEWVEGRKHKIAFTAIDKTKYSSLCSDGSCPINELGSLWCTAAVHLVLGIQKGHQSISNNKGHSVFIFDREVQYEDRLIDLVRNPPKWTNLFYELKSGSPLNQVVDVPYFADSRHALLIQVADLIAYVIRKHIELTDGKTSEKYAGEREVFSTWFEKIKSISLPVGTRWPQRNKNATHDLFCRLAPDCLL